jgi:hypothetical protein
MLGPQVIKAQSNKLATWVPRAKSLWRNIPLLLRSYKPLDLPVQCLSLDSQEPGTPDA